MLNALCESQLNTKLDTVTAVFFSFSIPYTNVLFSLLALSFTQVEEPFQCSIVVMSFCFLLCALATRFEAARKINALLKENEPADLTKRVSVHPENYQDDSDDSDPNETLILSQPLQLKVTFHSEPFCSIRVLHVI